MDRWPFVTIGMIAKNESQYIRSAIESLAGIDYPNDCIEIIFVDGNSTDGTSRIVDDFSKDAGEWKVKVFREEKDRGGRAYSRNLIVSNSDEKAELIAFTDADCVVKQDWLKNLVLSFNSDEGNKEYIAGAGGTRLCHEDDPFMGRAINAFLTSNIGSGYNPAFVRKKIKLTESIPNYNAIYRKIVLVENPYDEDFRGGEDLELNYRLRKKGYLFMYVDASVIHHEKASFVYFIKQMYHYGKVMAQAVKKHRTILRWYSILPVLLVIYLLLGILFVSIVNQPVLYAILLVPYIAFLFVSAMINTYKNKGAGLISIILMPAQHMAYGLGFIREMLT